MDSIENYLEKVMTSANLFHKDSCRVESELRDHLHEIFDSKNKRNHSKEEVWKMVEQEFGDAQALGQEIAKAKGKFLTYCKKSFLSWKSWVLGIGIVLIFFSMASFFYIKNARLAPILQEDSIVLAWRWVSDYSPGDIVIYKNEGQYRYALVKKIDGKKLLLSRGEQEEISLEKNAIWGKVIVQTR
ncbi:S24/S26 family peptidase [Candidatus Uabimicrobium amorphum]|uniref:Uncharacterized protein n=1 Tax=Uabimicrobium amorphum TaxID=2596890 RepID=A0A5S9IP49_UABAM|nr:S24/S26 family peptidase [Candidatus Uabimicrobium amorphum]BBM85469.1 hypothetical protein UABAM_03838 [Candidatus Uabimicrobium amorphum]